MLCVSHVCGSILNKRMSRVGRGTLRVAESNRVLFVRDIMLCKVILLVLYLY
jgi:hypothetical protein